MRPLLRRRCGRASFAIRSLFVSGAVLLVAVRLWLVQPYLVRGASMSPTLRDGDLVFLENVRLRVSDPRRGDLVGFRDPRSSSVLLKRVIGLPGETLEAKAGAIFVQASGRRHRLREPYVVRPAADTFRVHLSPTQLFVLGDNRRASIDSRSFGPISRTAVVGVVLFAIAPPSFARRLLRHWDGSG